MRAVFLDTAWAVGLLLPRDQLHAKAVALVPRLAGVRLVTHRGVLCEIGNALSKRPLRSTGIGFR